MIELASIAASLAVSFKVCRAAWPYLRPSFTPPAGKYVIVTGSTDGMGKRFAMHLTQKGIPLVLVGRNEAKLKIVSEQLRAMPNAKDTKIVKIDYSDQKLSYDSVHSALKGVGLSEGQVSGVINCCGTAFVEKYSDLPWEEIQRTKKVNTSALQIALKILNSPLVIEKPFLVSISSSTARHPLKYSSVYSATKAYLSNLIAAWEQENQHVRTLSVEPWFVKTKLIGFKNTWDTVLPSDLAQGVMKALSSRRKICAGTFKHELFREFEYLLEKLDNGSQAQQNYKRMSKLKNIKLKRSQRQSVNLESGKPIDAEQGKPKQA